MKTFLLILLFILLSLPLFGQVIYVTDIQSEADVIVYVTSARTEADLYVMQVQSPRLAVDNQGRWYYTKSKTQSDFKVYFTSFKSKADILIYEVESLLLTGWTSLEKSRILAKYI